METNVRLSHHLVVVAQQASHSSDRTVKEQIEHWVKLGQLMEENPHMTYESIKNLLKAL